MFDRSTARRLIEGWRLPFLFSLAAAAVLAQSGCTTLSQWAHNGFKVGPNYTEPPVLLPNQWIDTNDPIVKHRCQENAEQRHPSMPLNTATPSERRISAPAPWRSPAGAHRG